MSEFVENDFQKIIEGRHSVHLFDKNVKISHAEMDAMIDEAVTAPSAVNMQPWRIFVAESDAIRAKLQPLVRFNTRQLETASAMVFFLADKEAVDSVTEIYNTAVEEGKMPAEVRDRQLAGIIPMYASLDDAALRETFTLDTSLAAMQFMLVARAHGYETNPMSGFEHREVVEALGLDAERYVAVLMVGIGKPAMPGFESVRWPAAKITQYL